MKRSLVETILGAIVIAVAVLFFIFSYNKGEAGTVSGYALTADFTDIGGGSEDMLEDGDAIEYTQASQNLEQLLGEFIFSMNKDDKK